MIISHKYKYIFIKNYKVAGTSVEMHLSAHVGPDDIVTPFQGEQELALKAQQDFGRKFRFQNSDNFWNHMPFSSLTNLVSSDILKTYTKFCIDRHPEEKALSSYYFCKKALGDQIQPEQCAQLFQHYRSDFFRYSLNGYSPMDHIIHYENLEEELGMVLEKLGVPYSGKLGINAKGGIRNKKSTITDLFSDSQIEQIWKNNVLANELLQWRDPSEIDPEQVYSSAARCDLLCESGMIKEAKKQLENITGDYHEVFYADAKISFAENDFDAAKKKILSAISINDSTPDYFILLGLSLLRSSDASNAENAFRKAVDLNPGWPRYRMLLSSALQKNKKLEEAISEVKTAIGLRGDIPNYYNQLGLLYSATRDKENAEIAFKKACEIDPNNETFKNNLHSLLTSG